MSEMINIIVPMMGGLALFLYGMRMMSNGLELTAGNQMKSILEKLTSNPLVSIAIGAAVTALIQSSSATTVMLVSFVGSGIMTLDNAVWIIFGANIGATMTNLLTALNINMLACVLAMLGVGMIVFIKKPKINNIGLIIAGLGILFIGMKQMSGAVEPLKEMQAFRDFMVTFTNPIIGVIFGALFTALIQSSSASIGILQSLSMTGAISLQSSVYLIFGMNIGTCITAALASVGGSKDARRTAVIHLLFNIIGTVVFVIMIQFFPFVKIVESMSTDPKIQIANANIIYKVASTIIFLPFGKKFVEMSRLIVRGDDEPQQKTSRLANINLSNRSLGNISVAIASVSQEIDYMMLLVIQNVTAGFEALIHHDNSEKEELYLREQDINACRSDITAFMEKVSTMELNLQDSELIMSYYKVTNELERLGDYARHLMSYAESDKPLNTGAIEEIKQLYDKLSQGLMSFETDGNYDPEAMRKAEHEIDTMIEKFIKNQSDRAKNHEISPSRVAVYSNVLTDVQRMFDHMFKIVNEGTKHNYSVIAPNE